MQLNDLRRWATTVATHFFEKANGGKLLVVVLEDLSVRGILVRKNGRNGLELLRFLEVPFETSITNSKLKLAHLFKAWGEVSARRVLIVTDEFTSTPAELPKPGAKRFGAHKAKQALHAAARYEISPYLEYPAAEALVSVFLTPPPADELDAFDLEESKTEQGIIFAVHDKTYQVYKQVCKTLKIRLVGLVPHEIFAFSRCASGGTPLDACLITEGSDGVSVVINWRLYDALAALVVNNVPAAFTVLNFNTEEPVAQTLLELARDIAQDNNMDMGEAPEEAAIPPIVLGGEGAEQDWKQSFLDTAPEASVRAWDMGLELPGVAAPGPVPLRYMTALSAASQTLRKDGGAVLVHDRTPLSTKILTHPLAIPVAALLLTFALLGAEYGWWHFKIASVESAVAALEDRKKVQQEAAEKENDVLNSFNTLKKNRKQLQDKIKLIEVGLPERQLMVQAFFAGLIAETPPSIQLEKIHQFSEQVWFIEGVAQRYDIVSKYVVQLKNLPMTRQCRLEKSSVKEDRAGDISDITHFSLRIRLEEG